MSGIGTSTSRPLDKDKLYQYPRDAAIRCAHQALRPISTMEPEPMMAGVAVLFALVCSRVGVDPQDMHMMALRMMRHQEHHDKENKLLQSLRDFAGMRIAGQEVVAS